MTYNELYNNLRKYSTEDTITILDIELSCYLLYTGEEYVYGFTHEGIHYLILENYETNLKDKILIDINLEVKKLIRKRKIALFLNGN